MGDSEGGIILLVLDNAINPANNIIPKSRHDPPVTIIKTLLTKVPSVSIGMGVVQLVVLRYTQSTSKKLHIIPKVRIPAPDMVKVVPKIKKASFALVNIFVRILTNSLLF